MPIDVMEAFRKAKKNQRTQFIQNLNSVNTLKEEKYKKEQEKIKKEQIEAIMNQFKTKSLYASDGSLVESEIQALAMAVDKVNKLK